jgi:hypothetical protein
MITILEAQLDFTTSSLSTVVVPVDSEIVAARLLQKAEDEVFMLWLLADETSPLVHDRKFALLITGQPLPGNLKKYIGTFLMGTQYKHVVELEM